MASTNDLASTLPKKAPNTAHHRDTLNGLGRYKFAIYSTASLDSTSLHQLEASINSAELSTHNSKLAPEPSKSSLRDVYDYHLALRDRDDTIHPLYFIVADRADLPDAGVLVVHLNCGIDNEDDVVGVARCGVDMADSHGANIDIGNIDWLDIKEEEADSWGGDTPYADRPEGDAQPPLPPTESRPVTYGWYSLVQKAVPINSMLDPNWRDKKPEECRFQMLGNYHSMTDPWKEIRQAHPRQCALRPNVHRTLVLAAEREDAKQPGAMTIAHLKWDGDVSQVQDAGPYATPELEVVKRVAAGDALQELEVAAQELKSARR